MPTPSLDIDANSLSASSWMSNSHMTMATEAARASMESMRYAMLQDRAGAFASEMMAKAFENRSMTQLMRSNDLSSQATAMAFAGLGVAGSAMDIYGTGDPRVLMSGLQQGLANGGFTMQTDAGARKFFGGGALTEQISRRLFGDFQNTFMSSPLTMDYATTRGMNNAQIGEIFQILQTTGAFTGANIGKMGSIRNEDQLTKIRAEAAATGDKGIMEAAGALRVGDTHVTLDPNFETSAKKMITGAAKTFATLREVFGDESMRTLAFEAQRITGISVYDAGAMGSIRSRIEGLRDTARGFGVNERAYMEFNFATQQHAAMGLAGIYGGDPSSYRRFAGGLAPSASFAGLSGANESIADAKNAAAEGRFAPVRSREEIAQQYASNVSRLVVGETGLVETGYILSNFNMTDEQRTRGRQLISDMGQAVTSEQREGARAAMRKFAGEFGVNQGALIGLMGRSDVLNHINADVTGAMQKSGEEMNQALNANQYRKLLGSGHFDAMLGVAGADALRRQPVYAKAASDFNAFFGTYDSDTRQKLMTASAAGDIGAIDKIVGDNASYLKGMSKEDMVSFISKNSAALHDMNALRETTKGLADQTNRMSIAEDHKRVLEKSFESVINGTIGLSGVGMIGRLANGFVGTIQSTDENLIELGLSGQGAGKEMQKHMVNLAYNAQRGLGLGDDGLEKLIAMGGDDLFKHFGVAAGDKSGLSAALSGTDGALHLASFAKDKDWAIGASSGVTKWLSENMLKLNGAGGITLSAKDESLQRFMSATGISENDMVSLYPKLSGPEGFKELKRILAERGINDDLRMSLGDGAFRDIGSAALKEFNTSQAQALIDKNQGSLEERLSKLGDAGEFKKNALVTGALRQELLKDPSKLLLEAEKIAKGGEFTAEGEGFLSVMGGVKGVDAALDAREVELKKKIGRGNGTKEDKDLIDSIDRTRKQLHEKMAAGGGKFMGTIIISDPKTALLRITQTA